MRPGLLELVNHGGAVLSGDLLSAARPTGAGQPRQCGGQRRLVERGQAYWSWSTTVVAWSVETCWPTGAGQPRRCGGRWSLVECGGVRGAAVDGQQTVATQLDDSSAARQLGAGQRLTAAREHRLPPTTTYVHLALMPMTHAPETGARKLASVSGAGFHVSCKMSGARNQHGRIKT